MLINSGSFIFKLLYGTDTMMSIRLLVRCCPLSASRPLYVGYRVLYIRLYAFPMYTYTVELHLRVISNSLKSRPYPKYSFFPIRRPIISHYTLPELANENTPTPVAPIFVHLEKKYDNARRPHLTRRIEKLY